jgi:hypothetical protein
MRVSKTNYLHLLRETIGVLSQVQMFLDKEENQASEHIAEAIGSLQNVVRCGGTRAVKNASEAYRKKVEEEIRKKKWLEQLKKEQSISGQESSEVQPENR